MCGITGALDLSGKRIFHQEQLLNMMNAILHRGPDEEGIHLEPGVALGARRLSIIDIAKGHQPVTNKTADVWVTFNGELFDHPELRQLLSARGHSFHSHCDTEIWTHLYEEYGMDLFSHVKGQFAVQLWDRKENLMILARDRMGICPLYYTESQGWLLWASEIKALLASGFLMARPDVKGIDYLFNFFCAGNHRTFFEGIKLIPPGHFLKIKKGKIECHAYWDLDFPNQGEERRVRDSRELVDEYEALFKNAVKKRLRSDVPVVSYLSGGIDSTMVLNMANQIERNHALHAFSIGLEEIGPNEKSHAKESAELLGSKLTTVPINAMHLKAAFPEFIKAAEGPVLDTSCVALMLLAKEVHAQGYKVALTGEGADEALAGYFYYKTQKVGNWLGPFPQLFRKIFSSRVTRDAGVQGIRPAQQYMYESVGKARESLYSKNMCEKLRDHNPYDDWGINHPRIKAWHPLNQSLYVGYKVMLPGLLMLSKGDRVAMHSSVETRYPYLDEDVIAFCASIDPSYKLHGLKEKWLLRSLAMKTLPRKIAQRRKISFRTHLSQIFFQNDQSHWVDQLLSVESLKKTDYFNPVLVTRERRLQQILPRFLPRQLIFDAALTCVITTQLWHHIFFGGGLCELPFLGE